MWTTVHSTTVEDARDILDIQKTSDDFWHTFRVSQRSADSVSEDEPGAKSSGKSV